MSRISTQNKAPDCTHPFVSLDNHNKGKCSLCRAELQYHWEGKVPPVVLKPGISLTGGDPKNLPIEVKVAIAKAAKERGIAFIVRATGLEMKIVRAWVGAYTREPGKKGGRPPKKAEASLLVAPLPLVADITERVLLRPAFIFHGRYRIYSF